MVRGILNSQNTFILLSSFLPTKSLMEASENLHGVYPSGVVQAGPASRGSGCRD